MRSITPSASAKAAQAAHQKAYEMGVKMSITVVDAGANLTAFARMDDAWLGPLDISIKKAKTARSFQQRSFQQRPHHFFPAAFPFRMAAAR